MLNCGQYPYKWLWTYAGDKFFEVEGEIKFSPVCPRPITTFFIPERNTMMSSNQAQFDETVFPFRNKEVIEKYQSDQSTDILFRTESDVKWIPYNLLYISNYTRVHFDPASDLMVMRVNTETNSFTRVTQNKWIQDKLA